MHLSNEKLLARGTKMLMEALGIEDEQKARSLLIQHGSVKKAILTKPYIKITCLIYSILLIFISNLIILKLLI
jgi:hypothetical protein